MDNTIENKAIHIKVDGHVQGVGFRYFVYEKATSLNLMGWVRNRYDGSVEIWAQGNSARLQDLLDAIHIGPSRSFVSDVKFEWFTDSGVEYTQFSMLPTE